MKKMALVVALILFAATAHAEIAQKTVDYKQGDTSLEGTLLHDDALAGRRPGVLVVHQWMGPTEHELNVARNLAALGFVAFVADIYGKGVRPANPAEAGAQATRFRADRALLRARVAAALAALKAQPETDPERVAAIGYCFGGGAVLELARSGADLAGVVSFHGNLDTPNPADAKQIRAPLLVLHGAADPHVAPAAVAEFNREMVAANVPYTFVAYPDAVHAFTQKEAGDDPTKGVAYNADADAASWAEMRRFFERIF